MDLARTREQDALVATFVELLAKRASPEQVRAAEPRGFDAGLWGALLEVGVVEMAVPEDRGGWGADLLDLALVAEPLGAAVAPVPVVETQVAARLLASSAPDVAMAALAAAMAGSTLLTVAVRPAADGRAALVPAAAVADAVIVLDGARLLLAPLADADRHVVANLASSPLADVEVGPDAIVLAAGETARDAFERAVDEWLALTAASLVGTAAQAHAIACEYARERRTWGQPIGAYQAVAHPLADGATAIDGARLLAQRAAWELVTDGPRARELAAMAFAVAAETARDVTYDALHFHGGYGFMLEHDVQLHYRRARGWARVWGEPRDAYRRAARARYGLAAGA